MNEAIGRCPCCQAPIRKATSLEHVKDCPATTACQILGWNIARGADCPECNAPGWVISQNLMGHKEGWVGFTESHLKLAKTVAVLRMRHRGKDRIKGIWGQADQEKVLLGAVGELAVSLRACVPWPAYVSSFSSRPDLEPDHEVKTTIHLDGRLFVSDDEQNPIHLDRKYWLACVDSNRRAIVPGWTWGSELRELPLVDPQGRRPCRIALQRQLRPHEEAPVTSR